MIYDLHSHTTASDGQLSPTQLVDYAIERGLFGVAITDHNTVDGILDAVSYAKNKDIEIIPGIEISCDCENKVKEVHVVGLFIDCNNFELKELKKISEENSVLTAKEIIDTLKFFGYEISLKELEKRGGYGKNRIAYLLVEKYPKDFENRKDVFNKMLGWGKPAMVYGRGLSIRDAISRIHNAGGLAILAHPGQLRDYDDYFIDKFISLGGDGLEVGNKYSYLEDGGERNIKYAKYVNDNNLVVSLGSDFHLKKEGKLLGDFGISKETFLKLKERLK